MAKKPKSKMPAAERAKQFMPFAAVRGLEQALAEKEREMGFGQKDTLSEEQAAALDRRLRGLIRGETVAVTYFSHGSYQTRTGIFDEVDPIYRTLSLEDETVIAIDDIKEIT